MIRRLTILSLAFLLLSSFARASEPDCLISAATLSGHKFTNGELLTALFGLQSGSRAETFHPQLILELKRLGGNARIRPPFTPPQFVAILEEFRRQVGPQDFAKLVGELARPLTETALTTLSQYRATKAQAVAEDLRDMNRGFGYRLLPRDDIAFTDPLYVARMLASLNANAPGYPGSNVDGVESLFENAWSRLAPNTNVIDFTITGSDAVNDLPTHLLKIAKRRHPKAVSVELLTFEGMWVGTKGLARELQSESFRGTIHLGGQSEMKNMKGLPSPVTYSLNPSPEEIARLEPIEEAVLKEMQMRFDKAPDHRPIGGVLIEPILGAGGVLFYRREFLQAVRDLCNRNQVPVVADEILTGGGRTGKFFAYEHYSGFHPDFLLFGKGLITSGVATVKGYGNLGIHKDFYPSYGTTIRHQPETLLKAAQVLNRIAEGKLVQNAAETGEYFLKRLHSSFPADTPPERLPRGIGLLLYDNNHTLSARDGMGRYMPPITLTKAEVDQFFEMPFEPTWTQTNRHLLDQKFERTDRDGYVEYRKVNPFGYELVVKLPKATGNERIPGATERGLASLSSSSYTDPSVIPAMVNEAETSESAMQVLEQEAGWQLENRQQGKQKYRALTKRAPDGRWQAFVFHANDLQTLPAKEKAKLLKAMETGTSYTSPTMAKIEFRVAKASENADFKAANTAPRMANLIDGRFGWLRASDVSRKSLTLIHPLTDARIELPWSREEPTQLDPDEIAAIFAAMKSGQDYLSPRVKP